MADFTATALEKLGVRNVISSDICLNIPSFLRGATEQQTTQRRERVVITNRGKSLKKWSEIM